MQVAPSTESASMDVAAAWERRARELKQGENTTAVTETLLAYICGRPLSLDQRKSIETLSPASSSILAIEAAPRLAAEAKRLITIEFDSLRTSESIHFDAVATLSRVGGVYQRWDECLQRLGNGSPSSFSSSWIQKAVDELGEVIQSSIYDDLASNQTINPYQSSMQGLHIGKQWNIYANRAAQKLVLDRVRAAGQEANGFEEGALSNLQSWLESSLIATLKQWQLSDLDEIHSRLDHDISVQLGRMRSRQLFEIITEFPLSTPALVDLKVCKDQTNLQPYISRQLSQSLQARLLHPGASTRDIIQFYTHLIRALRFIDPSGVILSHVIGPVRTYLRARSDTISVIVASLLGQAGDFTLLRDMMRETGDAQGLGAADTSLAIYEEEEDGSAQSMAMNLMTKDESTRMVVIPSTDEEDWTPRPVDAGPDYRQSRKSDVIAIIVSIFDDEEGFVAALEKSCAEQLVKVQGYDMSKEYETNENLKKRFGDASLSRCDVMLNDVKKSQRYDRSIQSKEATDTEKNQAFRALHPFILSRQFWPPMKEAAPAPAQLTSSMFGSAPTMSTLDASSANGGTGATILSGKNVKMPGQFAKALEQYQDAFKKMAPMQRLRWFNARSSVSLELEMNDGRRIKEKVTPLQAAIVEVAADMNASRLNPMTSSMLESKLEVDKESIRDGTYFWISRGILRATDADSSSFEIVEDASQLVNNQAK